MNFFHNLFKSKLDAMRAAAPRASIHLLHESNGFSIYLDEATAVRRITQLGTLTDHAEDILEETVPVLFIPLEQCVKFVEEVTASHSVGLVDVILADKVNNARYVMYAYFGKKSAALFADYGPDIFREARTELGELRGMYDKSQPLTPEPAAKGYEQYGFGPGITIVEDPLQRALAEPIVSSVIPYDADKLRAHVLVASGNHDAITVVPGSRRFFKVKEKDSLDADFWG